MPQEEPERYCFSQYEFVVAAGELYRLGHRLRLSDQQARLLRVLLERAGDVVSRTELRVVLWPDGEHLDHDHAIRNVINQLRDILRDSARQPRFIETLPKRGYRFLAPVTSVSRTASDSSPTIEPQPEPSTNHGNLPIPPSAEPQLALAAPPQIAEEKPLRRWDWKNWKIYVLAAAILLIVVGAGLTSHWFGFARPPQPGGTIVLGIAPLEAVGPQAERLAEPFRAELMDAVSQLPRIEVRATHSFPPAGSLGDLRVVAQRLQLDALLLGKIESQENGRYKFTFELIRGSDAVHLASFQAEGSSDQLGSIRDGLQRDLFRRLSSTAGKSLRPVRSTDNPAAYSVYLAGRSELAHHDDAAIQRAIVSFKQAISLDPSFSQAYAGLSSAYLLVGEHNVDQRSSAYASARNYASQAIGLNPDLGEAHATLGFVAFRNDWNPRASEAEFKRAIELEPNQAMHHILYALLLCNTGRSAEALAEISKAHSSDPAWPPIYITEMYVAASAHQDQRAIESAHALIELMPDWPLAYDQSGWAYWYAGRHKEAVQEWIRMARLEHDVDRLALEENGLRILSANGVGAYARLKLDAIRKGAGNAHPNDFQLSEWQLNAGQDDAALEAMRKMVREHDPEALQFAASPAYAKLHGNPAFNDLLSQIGLPRPQDN